MRKILVITLLACLGLACTKEKKVEVLRVALQPFPLYGPIFIAKQKQWLEEKFRARGIAIKWSYFQAGPPENESFAAGEQDIGVMGDSPAIIARSSGQDTRIVGISATGPKMLSIVVPASSTIASPDQLKGKKIGVVKGSYAHHLLALVLEEAHLAFQDVQIVNLAHADIGAALSRGELDAGAVWEPLLTNLEADGTAKVLRDGTGIKKGALVIVATNSFASKNPELVQLFLQTYQQGYEFIQAHPEEAAELISKEVRLSPDRLRKVIAKADFNLALHPDDIEELKKSENFMRAAGIIKAAVDMNAFIDNRYSLAAGIH